MAPFECSLCGRVWEKEDLGPSQTDCPACSGGLYSEEFTAQIALYRALVDQVDEVV